METFAARLASFDRVLYPEKRRSSSAKSAKPVAWPHSRPSPAELAHAGFFYNPYETNPDNTTCFLCRRALDGWEEDDNPITEHLKHTKDCGWAIMMDIQQHSSNPAEIEDPTGERIAQARQATFGESWPHDGKRGWLCQSDKMVEGGWYFCPNEESDDLATCPYCKLSLDGWEPKDDPFDEHYRRSSDCSFFVFAKPPGKKGKGSRSKKARVSKASRLSTQSTASEAPVSELDDPGDQSILSQSTTKTKSSKKTSKSKVKGTKSKKEEPVEPDSQMDVDTADFNQPEPTKTKRTRGKKRPSEEVQKDEAELVDTDIVEKTEPPAKKRATKSRNSTQHQDHDHGLEAVTEDTQVEEAPVEEKPKKSRGTTKKKTASKNRKVSTDSVISRAPSTTEILPNSEHDAAMDVDLEHEKPSREPSEEPLPEPSKKSKSKKKAKVAPEPSNDTIEHSAEIEPQEDVSQEPEQAPEPKPPVEDSPQPRRTSKRQSARSSDKVRQRPHEVAPQDPPQRVTQPETEPTTSAATDSKHHESFVSVEIPARGPEQEVSAVQSDKDTKKKVKRKASTEKQRKSKQADHNANVELSHETAPAKTEDEVTTDNLEQVSDIPQQIEEERPQERTPDQQSARRRSSRVPPKTVEKYSDIPREKQYAKSLAESRSPRVNTAPEDEHQHEEIPEPATVSPLPSPSKSTPSLSPQSSDAENQPPSLKPSVSRAPVLSPSKRSVRIPLATSTPSPSKRVPNKGSFNTSHPWTPIDIDGILVAGISDKENIDFNGLLSNAKGELTSPEKKMTVEEWIKWNAKNGEEKLKRECERVVSQFEREGARAMRTLEGIECTD
ncbi:hypothetical protein BO94DRAFT_464961 [Aspergillus sclerotioniger CBS 115572]|uniref:Chromosome segregation protein BIR1 n=1 Tax=Aspergillus sclerotioniger CBS 115572 TaxID=1450535 RepID=A0A317WTH4_9EURO|nr:hypothetical protein BO94DRAFT_464961 [Aspergillus sclerotioniger CBS 115572]PWY88582.1 hypothetical protein BO94DRAFT_464961 [Aspergillus sclerotioniger CBS 115572]